MYEDHTVHEDPTVHDDPTGQEDPTVQQDPRVDPPSGTRRTDVASGAAPARYLDAVELRRTRRLAVAAPLTAWLLTVALYVVTLPWMPRVWASHVDGEGAVSRAPHWPLALVGVLAAAAAFTAGWLLVREHTRAGHWHDLEKGVVVVVVSAGYGFLAAVLSTVLASLERTPEEVGPGLIGAGLLGFLLGVIGAIAVYTPALPRARVDRWTPRY